MALSTSNKKEIVSKFARTKNHGDDALLRLLVNELELEGFHVVGIDEILGQKSTAPVGVFSIHKPTASDQDDILLGVEVAKDLGRLDVGQSVVVQQKVILGVEAIEGTDSLLHRCANLRRDGVGGVLVKVKKPNQERRADLPTIGSKTVKLASEANLKGIAVEADETLIVDYDKVVQEAKDKGLFLIGIKLK